MWEDTKGIVKDFGKHFRTGVAYVLPFVLIGGIARALGTVAPGSESPFWLTLASIGDYGMGLLFVPIMAAYVSYSVAGTPGIAPGLIVGFLAQDVGSGLLGALFGGFSVGYLTRMLLRVSIPELWAATWSKLMPAVSTILAGLFVNLIIGPPIASFTASLTTWLTGLSEGQSALFGAIGAGMQVVDFGGPISKVYLAFVLGAMGQGVFVPLGVLGASVAVGPLGMALATFLAPRLYSKDERDYGKNALGLAIVGGYTEIVIPFAINDLTRVTIACTVGGAVAGAIAGALRLEMAAPVLGIVNIVLWNNVGGYLVAVITGSLVVAFLAILLKSKTGHRVEEDAVKAAE